jgi:ATP-dependent RNA helicase DDX27
LSCVTLVRSFLPLSADPTPHSNQPKRDKYDGLSRRTKRRKMAAEDDKEFNDQAAVAASIRSAKKSNRPRPITEDEPTKQGKKGGKGGKAGGDKKKKIRIGKGGFDTE